MERVALVGAVILLGLSTAKAQTAEAPHPSEAYSPNVEGHISVDAPRVEFRPLGAIVELELLGAGIYARPARFQLNAAVFGGLAYNPYFEIGVYSGVFQTLPKSVRNYRVALQARVNLGAGASRFAGHSRFAALALGGGVYIPSPTDDGAQRSSPGFYGTVALQMRTINRKASREGSGAPWMVQVGGSFGLRYHFLYGESPAGFRRRTGHTISAVFSFSFNLDRTL